MSTDKLDTFIANVMGITAAPAGMGGASTGIFGMTGTAEPVVLQLRKAVMEFAAAYRKNSGGEAATEQAKEIEGSLATLQAMTVITPKKCEQLLAQLDSLTLSHDESR